MSDNKMNKENSAEVERHPPAYNEVVANNGGMVSCTINGDIVNKGMFAPYGVNEMVTNVSLPPGQVMTMSTMVQQDPSLGHTVTGYDGERWMAPMELGMAPVNCPP